MEWAKKSNQKTLLGQLLVNKKLISQEQLDWAIEQQKKTGQRLGDVVTELNLISRNQVDAVLRKQRAMRLAASVVTALLGPIPVYASAATAPVAPMATQSAHNTQKAGGLRVMSDKEMSETTGQGVLEDTLGDLMSVMNNKFSYNNAVQASLDQQLGIAKKSDSGLKTLGTMAKLMNPLLMMFSYDFSIKDVVYSTEGSAPVINKDGSITLSMPSTIGQIRFDNIRVRGNTTGPTFGSIAINDIDMRGTTLTIKAR
ncbi:MAG: hypothetical protein IPH54_14165 [Rhodoferax sp.]|jgi:hypothetical protein|nr:hypothetical protein [Rhodoferax sp.]